MMFALGLQGLFCFQHDAEAEEEEDEEETETGAQGEPRFPDGWAGMREALEDGQMKAWIVHNPTAQRWWALAQGAGPAVQQMLLDTGVTVAVGNALVLVRSRLHREPPENNQVGKSTKVSCHMMIMPGDQISGKNTSLKSKV